MYDDVLHYFCFVFDVSLVRPCMAINVSVQSANHELALLDTFFSTAKSAISHTFNGRGKKCIDYILTRQRDRKLVRDVTVDPQPSFLYLSRITTSSQLM